MSTKKNTIYLLNNKKKEASFITSFTKVVGAAGYKAVPISSLACGFKYDRTSGTMTLYIHGAPVDPTTAHWFFRAWAPSEDASALLAIYLELHNVPFTDKKVNTAHEIRTSKLSQTFQLAAKNCPSPSTWVFPIAAFSTLHEAAEAHLGFPLVVKARGGLGKRVWKCDTKAALRAKISELKKEGVDDLVILQEMVENDGDIRVVVFKNKVIASIGRSNSDGFLNNVSRGGTASPITITNTEKSLALRAARAVNLELAGVDIVRSQYGPLLFEVNKAPDLSSFSKAAGFDIPAAIAEAYTDSLNAS